MSALIIGGDRIHTYRDYLSRRGFTPVLHWNGQCHRQIPVGTRLVVVLVDQVNHGLARKIRREAEDRAVPVVFSRRSLGQLGEVLAAVAP